MEKRERGKSMDTEYTLEDLTVMKLMEEIMEIDQEIKMKQSFINTRMKMLHNLIPSQKKQQNAVAIEKFMLRLQPDYPKKINYS